MKSIRLERLTITDFQGGTFTLEAGGRDVNVYADNGVGKTRLASAFSWLITGKDSLGRSDFAIKNIDDHGEAAHGLEHSVEAVLLIDSATITLKKVYAEKWTKTRGFATATFTGHSTQHYIDDVPVSEKDYQARVVEIAGDEQAFRLLTSPTAFPALHWEKQRAMLLSVCGDTTDADVIATDEKLAPLTEILKKYKSSKTPFNDHKKVVAARRAEINKELEKIPVRIDEQRRSLPDVTGLIQTTLNSDIARLSKSVADAALRLSGVDTGSGIAELSKRLAGINADLQKMETAHYAETMKAANRLNAQISEAQSKESDVKRRIGSIGADLKTKEFRLKGLDSELATSRLQWAEIDALAFQDTTVDACAACDRPLPAERVQAARDKALAAFNTCRAERLADNERRGKQMAKDRDTLAAEIAELSKERENLEAGIPERVESLQKMVVERDTVRALAEDYTVLGPPYEVLVAQKAKIDAAIEAARAGTSQASEKERAELKYLEDVLAAAKADADKFVRRETGEKRIDDLRAEEKKLAAEFERLESELFLCESFVRTKVSLLTDRINGRFETVRFKLFEEQVNGGLAECCEITVDGIPYGSGLNNAARINAGLDVCRTLSQHFGIQAPIFVDNAESVVKLIDMEAQVVRLVVSEGRWLPQGNPSILTGKQYRSKEEDGVVYFFVPDDNLRVEMAGEAVAA